MGHVFSDFQLSTQRRENMASCQNKATPVNTLTVPYSAGVWQRNYSSVAGHTEKILEVVTDPAKKGQVLVLSEADARRTYTNLVVTSLGAVKKHKPKRHRLREGEWTFALTADVAEAHRQIPTDPRDWHAAGSDVYVHAVGTPAVLVTCSLGTWKTQVADDFHLEAGGPHYRSALGVLFVRCAPAGSPSPGREQQVVTQCHGSVSNFYTAIMSSSSQPGEPSGSSDGSKTSHSRIQ